MFRKIKKLFKKNKVPARSYKIMPEWFPYTELDTKTGKRKFKEGTPKEMIKKHDEYVKELEKRESKEWRETHPEEIRIR